MQVRYIDKGILGATYNLNGVFDVADNTVSSATYVDMNLSYRLNMGVGSGELFANVTNLFDRAPPVAPSYSAFTAAPIQTNTGLLDVLGRRFTVGFKVDF